MFCSNCGTQVNDGANFCGGCGSRVAPATAPPPPAYQNPVVVSSPPPPIAPIPAAAPPATVRKGTLATQCPWCGAPVDATQSSCRYCGTDLEELAEVTRSVWG
mgnify:CR=1 FL=1